MIEKLRTFFFFHNYFFPIILSVTVCPSIRNLNAFKGGILNYRKYVSKDLVYAPKSSIDIHNIM